MSTPVENLERWIAALRSGKYEQGQNLLRSGSNRFCCLGVVCDVLHPEAWELQVGRFVINGMPTSLPESFQRETGIFESDCTKLIGMNDWDLATFAQIADYIEQNILPRVRSKQEKVQS